MICRLGCVWLSALVRRYEERPYWSRRPSSLLEFKFIHETCRGGHFGMVSRLSCAGVTFLGLEKDRESPMSSLIFGVEGKVLSKLMVFADPEDIPSRISSYTFLVNGIFRSDQVVCVHRTENARASRCTVLVNLTLRARRSSTLSDGSSRCLDVDQ